MSEVEKIVSAALKVGREVISLPPPARHADVIRYALVGTPSSEVYGPESVEGFLTSTGRFVDRVEAGKIARDAGQVGGFFGLPLQTVDLW
jgi:hypothetical protein